MSAFWIKVIINAFVNESRIRFMYGCDKIAN